MQYFEVVVTTYSLKDVYFDEANEKIGQLINKAMVNDSVLSERHKKNCFKYYVYDSLYPREQDKLYKKGRVYIFRIRSMDESFIDKIKKLIVKTSTDYLRPIATEKRVQKQRHISEIYTVTPALVTVEEGYWIKGDSLELLQERIEVNLLKKYRNYFGEDLGKRHDFIQMIELKNRRPIALKYKNIKLLGNKLNIIVKDDEISQKLAFTALGMGLLEKNSSNGMGFCIGKWT